MGSDLYTKQRKWFYTFLESTTQKQEFNNFLRANKERFDPLNDFGDKVVLDIGTGNGASFLPMIEEILKKHMFKCYVHETNLGVLVDFLKNYCVDRDRFVNTYLYDNKDKEYFNCTKNNYFDLITASHVFYYINDWDTSLKNLVDSLVPGGMAVITHTSEQGFLHDFRNEFFEKAGSSELNECRSHSGEELCSILDELGINYTSEVINSKTIVNEENFNDMVSFMLRTDYEKLSKGLKQEIKGYINQKGPELSFKDLGIIILKQGMFLTRGFNMRQVYELGDFSTRYLGAFLEKSLKKEIEPDLKGFSPNKKQLYYDLLLFDAYLSNPFHATELLKNVNTSLEDLGYFPNHSIITWDFLDKVTMDSVYWKKWWNDGEFDWVEIPRKNAEMPGVNERIGYLLNSMATMYLCYKYSYFKVKMVSDHYWSRKHSELKAKSKQELLDKRGRNYWGRRYRYLLNKRFEKSDCVEWPEVKIDVTMKKNQAKIKPFDQLLTELVEFYKSSNHSRIILSPGEESLVCNHFTVNEELNISPILEYSVIRLIDELERRIP